MQEVTSKQVNATTLKNEEVDLLRVRLFDNTNFHYKYV